MSRGFRAGQNISASLVSLAHGTNDAQKTMGIITLIAVGVVVLSRRDPVTADNVTADAGPAVPVTAEAVA